MTDLLNWATAGVFGALALAFLGGIAAAAGTDAWTAIKERRGSLLALVPIGLAYCLTQFAVDWLDKQEGPATIGQLQIVLLVSAGASVLMIGSIFLLILGVVRLYAANVHTDTSTTLGRRPQRHE